MRLGIDIDGVLADTFPLLVAELNDFFNRDIHSGDVYSYNIREVYDIDASELEKFIQCRENILTEGPDPVPGAVDCVNMLKEQNEVFIISARRQELRPQTIAWLTRHGLAWDELILLGTHNKAETCLNLKLDVLVEDNLQNSRQVSSLGIPVLLLDAPYNQGLLPPGVKRCYSWEEICRELLRPTPR